MKNLNISLKNETVVVNETEYSASKFLNANNVISLTEINKMYPRENYEKTIVKNECEKNVRFENIDYYRNPLIMQTYELTTRNIMIKQNETVILSNVVIPYSNTTVIERIK